jgi:8-oxo-dGTP pyrophosphatase MutT (NUDIX family)
VIRWRSGEVSALGRSWRGAIELQVRVGEDTVPALAYPELTGAPQAGDRVLLNTAALDLGLGTGGYALVVAIPDRLPADSGGPGHLIKARYTPLQAAVHGADEQGSPYHELLRDADDLAGLPVVVADLHSAVPAILAGYLAERRPVQPADGQPAHGQPAHGQGGDGQGAGAQPRIAYVMLDGGALPAWFSRSAAALTQAGWLTGTVTVGQAFGGDLEAVSLHSGLLAARHVLGAELAVVAQGPGNLGTGTRWGFSGVAAGEAVNAAAVLGGRPVGSLRISEADQRARHHGISHHSLTCYGRVALARADIVVPDLPGEFGAQILAAARPLAARHNLVRVSVAGLAEILRDCPVQLSTMGRGLNEDLMYFLAAAAAGRHAATLHGGAGSGYDLERSCVRIVLQDRAGRVLLFRAVLGSRSPEHWWELPGGGIEPGESYQQAAVREIREETGLQITTAQVSQPRWRRTSTWTGRGIRRLQHEVVVAVQLDADAPAITDAGQTAEELEEYIEARWWDVADIAASTERFYPGRLAELLPAFLAGADITEPFEHWN